MFKKSYFSIFILASIAACSSTQHSQVLVVAHRSAPGYLPEHTLAGVAMAHSWNVDYVEPDVVLTKDGVPVILHDVQLDTTTNVEKLFPKRKRKDGHYYAIDFTLAEVKSLNVHERANEKTGKAVFPKRFPIENEFFKVPTLDEYLKLVNGLNKSRSANVGVYLELKADTLHKMAKMDLQTATLRVLEANGFLDPSKKLILQSFEPETLKSLRKKLGPNVTLLQLVGETAWSGGLIDYDAMRTPVGLKAIAEYANGLGPQITDLYDLKDGKIVSNGLAEEAHRLGLKVHPYTHRVDALSEGFEDDEKLFKFLFDDLKVDGIFSDFGDRALMLLGR